MVRFDPSLLSPELQAIRERALAQAAANVAAAGKVKVPRDRTEYFREYDAERQATRPKKYLHAPFVGVDGEGGGVDQTGRQNYLLLRAGTELLFNANKRLTSEELLNFLADLDPSPNYVAYYFNYDVTMILRDVDVPIASGYGKHLGGRRLWKDFAITYTPGREFTVCRGRRDEQSGKIITTSPTITINDVGQFFQCAFLKALTDWQMGTPEILAKIAAGKASRQHFELMTETEIEYNRLECEMLAEMMEAFRQVCILSDIVPMRWQGPGWVAARMFDKMEIPKRKEYLGPARFNARFLLMSQCAYYGGRFETTVAGDVRKPIYEYDINSAYPAAMGQLPCMTHGRWVRMKDPTPDDLHSGLYVAKVHFKYKRKQNLYDFPIRTKAGTICWPQEGLGWYWSPEIQAAYGRSDVAVNMKEAWIYRKECDCVPFAKVEEYYLARKAIGKSTKGYSLKLGLNSLYGKLCQHIGSAPYANPVWGGLITAITRAQLIKAYTGTDDRDIIMLATDGVYSTVPLSVEIGSGLGTWECKQHVDGMFIVQPGIYFYNSPGMAPKTRGVPRVRVASAESEFRETFAAWLPTVRKDLLGMIMPEEFPFVPIEMIVFIGSRLAAARGKPEISGTWMPVTKKISFDWTTKRSPDCRPAGSYMVTKPYPGGPNYVTVPYDRLIGGAAAYDSYDLLRSEQPDYLSLFRKLTDD